MTTAKSKAASKHWETHAKERKACVLWAIQHFTADNGYPPSVREVGDICGFSSTDNVHHWLTKLRDEGKVNWMGGKARTLRVLEGAQ